MEQQIRQALVKALGDALPQCPLHTERMPQHGIRDGLWIYPAGLGLEGRIGCQEAWSQWEIRYLPPMETPRQTMVERLRQVVEAVQTLQLDDGPLRPVIQQAECDGSMAVVLLRVRCRVRIEQSSPMMRKFTWEMEMEGN
ncbi:MAG: hypothetical protein ACOX7F_05360 [Eubacteriales bacterium]